MIPENSPIRVAVGLYTLAYFAGLAFVILRPVVRFIASL